MMNEASDYVDKLAGALLKSPQEITKLNKQKIERISQILTGLYVVQNEKFRKTLKVSDTTLQRVVTGLKSTQGAANFTAKIGTRLPSMLAQHKQMLTTFDRQPQDKKDEYISSLEKLHGLLINIPQRKDGSKQVS